MFDRTSRFVLPAGILLLAVGLAACGGSRSAGPQVSAGADEVVSGSRQVMLTAASGADRQRYRWNLVSKPTASRLTAADIRGADSATARFTPDVAGVYVLQVTLDSGHGTATDSVKITSQLAVEAGPDQTVQGSEPVTLHARSNAAKPVYRWSFTSRPPGSQATLSGADSATTRFTPDAPGVYKLRVSLDGDKASQTVMITAEHVWQPGVIPESTAPTADATSLAIAPDGTLYLAYHDENEGGKTVVKKLDGDKWTKLGGVPASTTSARFMSLAVSPQGRPVVAFQDFTTQGRGGVTVRQFVDGKWMTVGQPGFSAGEAAYVTLAIAPDGTPWVAYQDFSNVAQGGLTVQKFDHGKWQVIGRPGFSPGKARYVSLAIARDGTPWVAWQDLADTRYGVSAMTFDGKRWNSVGNPGFTPQGAIFVSLALSPNGSPYVIYEDGGPEHPASIQAFDGNRWAYVGEAWFTRGEAEFTTLAIADDGTPYVAYQDEVSEGLSVRKFDGKQWQYVGNPGFSSGEAEGISFVIGADDTLYVSYRGEKRNGEPKEEEEQEAISVKRFDGKRWIQAGGTVDAWGEDGDRRHEH